jgi:hypothetical protein
MYRTMMGDYLPGYGDPGIFGAIGRTLGGAIGGFIKGGPVGAILGAASGAGSATAHNIHEATLSAGGGASAYTPTMRKHHALIVARSKLGAATAPIGGLPAGTAHGLGPRGALMPGRGRARHVVRADGTIGLRRRRMNWSNPRALARAERRIGSALKHFSKYFTWKHHKPGHLVPKIGHHKKK